MMETIEVGTTDISVVFDKHRARFTRSNEVRATIESNLGESKMGEMTREEVQARLEASEARVATAVESMRADSAALRADLQTGVKAIEAQGQVMRSEAAAFFADARRVLADIQVAQERDRNQYYALGYKIIVWAAATFIALAGTFATVWKAFHVDPAPQGTKAEQPTPSTNEKPAPPQPIQAPPPSKD